MSNYTIEISGNQPYYVQVDNSSVQSPINLDVIKNNDINVEVSTSNTFITLDLPNIESFVRTSGNQSISGIKTFNNNIVISGYLATKAEASNIGASHFPVFISDPSTFARNIHTRTPSQLKSDLALNNVQNVALSNINFSAGSGLIGGGNLSSNRSFDIGQGDGLIVSADSISLDSTVVRTTGNQIITSSKTFTSPVIFNSGTFTSLRVGATGVALSGHTHNVSDITDFTSGVNSLLTSNYALSNHTHTSFAYLNVGSPSITNYLTIQVPAGYDSNDYQDNAFFQIINNDSGDTVFGVDGYGKIIFGTIDVGNVNGLNDAILSQIPTSIVYTSGNQSISGVKTFTNNINVSGLITANSGNFTNSLNVNGTGVSISGHTHTISNVTGLQTALDTKQASGNYSLVGHSHSISDITLLQTTLDNKQPSGNYALSSHTHSSSNITDFNTSVDSRIINANLQPSGNYALSSHTHTSSDITNFNTSVSGLVNGIYAPLSSPSLTGTPLTPTASAGTNSTQIASTAFVRTEISNLVASAPTALDTLNELATALGNDANFSTTVTNNLAGKANLSGATFTGSVSGPSGNFTSLKVNNVDVSANGHTHTVSNITDFNSSVSGLLPTIANSGDNRILTSTGSSVGINAEGFLTFDGSSLNINGNIKHIVAAYDGENNRAPIKWYNIANEVNSVIAQIDISTNGSPAEGMLAFHTNDGSSLQERARITDIGYVGIGTSTPSSNLQVVGLITSNSGNFTNSLSVNGTGVSISGHTHSISNVIGLQTALDNKQPSGNYALSSHSHTSSNITDFNTSVDNRITNANLQPSGNYSVVGHTHTSSNITDFNSSVSGLLPVKNIISGTDIAVSNSSGTYTISSTASGVPQIYSTVFNNTGSPIPKMSVVYINGGQGDMPTVALSIADGESTSSKTYAVTTEAISNMSSGRVVVSGPLTALNTDQFNPTSPNGNVNGTTVWLSPTVSGGLTTTKPSAPYHMVAVGTIVRTHQNQGIIEVKIQNGFELHELHNVAINGVTDGQFLQYNSGSGLWLASSSGNFSTLNVNGSGRFVGTGSSLIFNADGNAAGSPSIEATSTYSDINIKVGGQNIFRGLDGWTGTWADSAATTYFQVGRSAGNTIFTSLIGNNFNRLAFASSKTLFTDNSSSLSIPSGYFNIVKNSSNLFTIMDDGKVGIGTTTPSGALHVVGDTYIDNSSKCYLVASGYSKTMNYIWSATNGNLQVNGGGPHLILSSQGGYAELGGTASTYINIGHSYNAGGTNQHIKFTPASIEAMRITSSGNVGIGTTTPSKKLDVIGDARVSGVLNLVNISDSTDRSIAVTSNNMTFTGVHGIFEYSIGLRGSRGSACGLESNATNGYLALAAGGSEKVRIATDGKVGIGTTTPSSQLHVIGSGVISSGLIVNGNLTFDSFTESVVAIGNSSTSQTISLTSGTVQTCTLTGNCTFTMPTATAGKSFTLFLNSGAGNYTATFTGVRWADSATPTATITASKVDIYSFISDGTYWYGSFSQNYG